MGHKIQKCGCSKQVEADERRSRVSRRVQGHKCFYLRPHMLANALSWEVGRHLGPEICALPSELCQLVAY